uniref:MHYT domain-containing protein n=1 Tax=Bicosoecida sp. CB-2014 TaxID=1486930 RepID=A0A7S1CHR4_9STRA|mmetsp:Transcript_2529/g.8648  ORF Transcript_2529/g.8648 Transcript_2529/m.8648 type:complete len:101 (+) Transcript_2529:253-555(+)
MSGPVPQELVPTWDAGLIALSFLVSALGADTALFLVDQERAIKRRVDHNADSWRIPWLMLAAVALGGCGIWCMHFTGMAAMALAGVHMEYDVVITVCLSV